jgi:hypothetical protein
VTSGAETLVAVAGALPFCGGAAGNGAVPEVPELLIVLIAMMFLLA